ncbi:conserved hypothetical protein [Frankia canadensis]|uniref:Uncharacterized protein n=1 Tax=Frankia canadensis TaxID=1836972 RepID=A0A2I2KWS5_9ACTN|nr:conserved hypothetical protein [Frankia canadensis]SOU57392.1 conserved hypothetical protein [Frankia canadensis]
MQPEREDMPNPKQNINATTTPTITVTRRAEVSDAARNSGHVFDSLDNVEVGAVTGHRPWSGSG